MSDWLTVVRQVEALEDIALDPALIARMQGRGPATAPLRFFTPGFKSFQSSELAGCGKNAWPAVSITGAECKLRCDHCQAKILAPMRAARTPAALWALANEIVAAGGRGMLLTGGSNRRNEVEYDAYYPVLRRIKHRFPSFQIAVHTALVDAAGARSMADSGVDTAMMDVIGAQDTVARVYHLKRPVADFERTLAYLAATGMKVVPHIVLGLHYGRLLGEWNALEIIARHRPDAVVLVVVMPFYAPAQRSFATPDAGEIGRFFLEARALLPDVPLLLGCARPPGLARTRIDAYAVLAGLDGIAYPADGVVELAARLGREVRVAPTCCAVAAGGEVASLADGAAGLQLDLTDILALRRTGMRGIADIPVVGAATGAGTCR